MNLLFSILALLLTGCGVEPAQAPREKLEPMALRRFPRQNWRLVNNKIFLWKETMAPADVSAALSISREIDRLDGAGLPLIQRRVALEAKIDPLKKPIQRFTSALRAARAQFDEANKELGSATRERASTQTKLNEEKAKALPSPEVVTQLSLQVAGLTARESTLTKQVANLKTLRDSLEGSLKEFQEALSPLSAELNEVKQSQTAIEFAGQKQVELIMQVCDWYTDPPGSINFQFDPGGAIQADFTGWKMNEVEAPRSFSTVAAPGEKATIGPVTYEELGGIFTFDLFVYEDAAQTVLRETWHWRMARIFYDYPDGRNFFGGEISRTRVTNGKTEVRHGLAKFVDRNN